MKIIVNNEIIDTENIYKITDIVNIGGYRYSFMIYMYNDIKIYVEIHPALYYNDDSWYSLKHCTDNKDKLEVVKSKITEIRNNIINVWSNNQTKIPKFNIYDASL